MDGLDEILTLVASTTVGFFIKFLKHKSPVVKSASTPSKF